MRLFGKNPKHRESITQSAREKDDRIYSYDNIKSSNLQRYIIVKGAKLKSIEAKLGEYGELPPKVNPYIYKFAKAQVGDWTFLRLPLEFKDYAEYSFLILWLLGNPSGDGNYADLAIGYSFNEIFSFVIYNDDALMNRLGEIDFLFGVFENNEKFLIDFQSDDFEFFEREEIYSFKDSFKIHGIDPNIIKDNKIGFVEFDVLINDKIYHTVANTL